MECPPYLNGDVVDVVNGLMVTYIGNIHWDWTVKRDGTIGHVDSGQVVGVGIVEGDVSTIDCPLMSAMIAVVASRVVS